MRDMAPMLEHQPNFIVPQAELSDGHGPMSVISPLTSRDACDRRCQIYSGRIVDVSPSSRGRFPSHSPKCRLLRPFMVRFDLGRIVAVEIGSDVVALDLEAAW